MSKSLQEATAQLIAGEDLSPKLVRSAFGEMMSGKAEDALIGDFLRAFAAKGETAEELATMAELMRSLSIKVTPSKKEHLVDTCGTGGDGASLFNISTAAALVAASGGARVAKHGNRAASSRSGSADVLECLGMPLTLSPEQVGRCIDEIGIGFLFAPSHHSAMKAVMPARKALGVPTVFNLLGPLSSPAGAKRQLLGVNRPEKMKLMAEALQLLGCEHAMVVHANDGLDELSIADTTQVVELRDGSLHEYEFSPSDVGIEVVKSLAELTATDPDTSANLLRTAINPKDARTGHPASLMVKLNGGAALYVSGVSDSLASGVAFADDLLCSGQVKTKLQEWIDYARVCAHDDGKG